MISPFAYFDRLYGCPACGEEAIGLAVEPDIGECSECGLLFRNPRPTQAEIARSYDTGGTFDAWQEQEPARAKMWDRRASIIQKFRNGGRLLDVGTGDGRFLQTCQKLGYETIGTEVSEAGASYARTRGFDVRMGQITDIELPPESFDAVTIWHVLEHVPDPGGVLRKVHSLLRPNGILAVAVPNEENFFVRRRFGIASKTSPFDPLQFGGEIHLTYFRPATFLTTMRLSGFEILEFGVDDIYMNRDWRMKVKFVMQRTLAKLTRWHFATAMYAIGKKRPTS